MRECARVSMLDYVHEAYPKKHFLQFRFFCAKQPPRGYPTWPHTNNRERSGNCVNVNCEPPRVLQSTVATNTQTATVVEAAQAVAGAKTLNQAQTAYLPL